MWTHMQRVFWKAIMHHCNAAWWKRQQIQNASVAHTKKIQTPLKPITFTYSSAKCTGNFFSQLFFCSFLQRRLEQNNSNLIIYGCGGAHIQHMHDFFSLLSAVSLNEVLLLIVFWNATMKINGKVIIKSDIIIDPKNVFESGWCECNAIHSQNIGQKLCLIWKKIRICVFPFRIFALVARLRFFVCIYLAFSRNMFAYCIQSIPFKSKTAKNSLLKYKS